MQFFVCFCVFALNCLQCLLAPTLLFIVWLPCVHADTADLNDKTALRRAKPARDGDFDPRLGPASAQVFEGEDLMAGERTRMQAEQVP